MNEYEDAVYQTDNYGQTELDRFRLLTALAGEVGELCNMVKKLKPGADMKPIVLELGDILWYTTALAHHFGTTLDDVADCNMRKVLSRKEQGITYNAR